MNAPAVRPIDNILSRLNGPKKGPKGWTARCPSHEDKERSLSLAEGNDGRVLIKCFAGCKPAAIVDSLGLKMRDLFSDNGKSGGTGHNGRRSLTVADLAADKGLSEEFLRDLGVVPVMDMSGRDVVRITYRLLDGSMAPRQRIRKALQAKKGSLWTKGRGALSPYGLWRLPEARQAGYLILVEGESDYWTLLFHGFPALGLPGADTGKLLESAYLENIDRVYLIQEPDQGGTAFVQGIARRLKEMGWAGKAFVVKLDGAKDPNELHKQNPESFKDTFQKALEAATPLPEPPAEEPKPNENPSNLPPINADDGDLKRVSAQAWSALMAANEPPKWFRCGGMAMRIETSDDGAPVMREITQDRLRHILARAAWWFSTNKKGDTFAAHPPMPVVRDLLATPDMALPILNRVVEAPVFAPNGELQTLPGYHSASRTYYAPATGFTVQEVPEKPTDADIAGARQMIEDVLFDFPFVSEAERAHAVALLLLPFARDLIDGPTPLHLIEAPSPGTGKTLLTDVLTFPAVGHPVTTMTEGRDEDEWRKRLTAKLHAIPSLVMLDNLRSRLDSAALSAAITSPAWEDRILGESKIVTLPVRCVWIATGNNPGLSSEMSRRTVRIRLDAKQDRPWLRQEFRHPNLRDWARERRADIVRAALVVIRAWIAAGRPMSQGQVLGMFEGWAKVMGSILDIAGFKGFLGNLEEFYEESDAEGSVWRGFVRVWWDKFGKEEVGVSELFEAACGLDEPLDLGKGSEKSQKTRLGQELVKMRDRQFDDLRLVLAGIRQRAKRWKLVQVGEPVNLSEPRPLGLFLESDKPTEIQNHLGSKGSPRFTGSLGRELSGPVASWPPYWKDLFEERAGQLEFEEGFPREEAETRAIEILRDMYARQNGSGQSPHPSDLEAHS